jgi:hypothetical protein
MKKLITLCISLFSVGMYAQSLSAYVISTQSGANTATLTNGYNLQLYTSSNNILGNAIKFKNNSATTHTYNMSRSFVTQIPMLDVSGDPDAKPNAYFCCGITCFPSSVNAGDPLNYTILGPGDDSQTAQYPAHIYLSEATALGYYVIHYKIFNVNDANDTLSFNAVYNGPVGIKDFNKDVLTGVSELYPNPTSGSAVSFDLAKDDELKFQVYNSLGSLVYTGSKQKYSAGKNKLAFDAASLSNGVYLVTISDNNSAKITKRLVVNK